MTDTITFDERCYALLQKIPAGYVTTYKAIAEALGSKAYRAVGRAMANNPNLITVPCHRVVKSDGSISGYALGTEEKIKLLESEGITIHQYKIVDFKARLYRFDITCSPI